MRGQGIGTEMVRKTLAIGFDRLDLHRISIGVFDFNKEAIACYEKVGFVKEGYLRESWRVGDEYWSIYIMSMLESEWKALNI
ncbi:putative acetyltransferase [Microseira wollei NIES-4236]|uniref:Acetyltransferase n=1 Tax=Microseira wollei NIES-4236 TaxID=2530354 RepID=A0AAV3X2Y7_9CYAN|nr:GNAT family protein [Microseira wollei]GET35556.1 putative acetyltransferase [Microseira wollei NIES-4236]